MHEIELQRIDASILPHYSQLEASDRCYFLGEFYSHQGYQYIPATYSYSSNLPPMNQLIFNLKKEMRKKGQSDWGHKEEAIKTIAKLIASTQAWEKLKLYTWIPLPPSKNKDDPEHDDRLLQILNKISSNHPIDIREMLQIKNSRAAAHRGGKRYSKDEHLDNLTINKDLLLPSPKALLMFDDVITTGASFKAAQAILRQHYPNVPIIGLFIARAVNL